MERYYLEPLPGTVKSFYCKAEVEVDEHSETLYSYGTPIMIKTPCGFYRIWDGYSQTTGRHIKAFSGLNKKQFEALPYYC